MIDSLDDFLRHAWSQKPLIGDVIADGELVMLFSESGVGKTFLAVDLALHIATGQPWQGRAVEQGPVVYLPSEGFDGFQARIRAWFEHRGVSSAGVPLHIGAYEIVLNNKEDFAELEGELDDIRPKPKLIVIDTLTGHTSGIDQNSAKDMAGFAQTCKMLKLITGAAVLVVHHSGHKDKGRSKGAVDLWAACDRVLGLSRSGRDGALTIKCAKSRNAPPFDDIHVRLQPFGPAAVLVDSGKPVNGEKTVVVSAGDRIFREVVGDKPIEEATAKAEFNDKYGKSPGANRNAWTRAFEKAMNSGVIEVSMDRLISPRTHGAHNQ